MGRIISAAVFGALVIGGGLILANSRHSSSAQADQPAPVATAAAPAPVAVPVAQPLRDGAPRRVVYRNSVGYYRTATPAPAPRVVRHTRSTKHSVEIIGGSTVGGALVGGLIGGKKGAVIGGLVGGGAGTVYDRKTRHKKVVQQ
jgi:hypothetical protein